MDTPHRLALATPERRRIVIVDDHHFFAACLRALLDSEIDLVVCDVATDHSDAPERIRRHAPDVLVIDVRLGTASGLELGRRLRREFGVETPILFVSTMAEPSSVELAGIARCGFTRKTAPPRDLLRALRQMLGPAPGPRRQKGAGSRGKGLCSRSTTLSHGPHTNRRR